MSILKEILDWTKGLTPWQSDAVGRLFAKQTLTQDDLGDLYALLKIEHGISDPKGRKPNPLAEDKIPAGAQPNVNVEMLAIKNLKNVNAIAENQRLSFGSKGLTVIYGDNGSGKSGYSRVLKKACRARDQNEPILGNASVPSGKAGPAQATFEISVNGVEKEVQWTDGMPAPKELSSFAILDSRCARAYLDEENDFAYVPYGLDILEGLAGVCKQLDGLIKAEQTQYAVDKMAFAELAGTQTSVGRLVDSLSAKTKPAEVEKLATVSALEHARRNELDKSLKADNPKENAAQLQLRAARITRLAVTATEKLVVVNDAALARLRVLVEADHVAKTAAELAARIFEKDGTLLPGTGGDAWKELFEAARRFSQEAHVGKKFPDLGADAQCPLCQQALNDGAARLLRFEQFVQQEAETTAKACKKALADQYRPFVEQDLVFAFDNELFVEIEGLDKGLAQATRDFERALSDRQKAIKEACAGRDWTKIAAEPTSTAPQLQSLAEKLIQEATTLEKASDEKARAALQVEFNELEARLKLSKLKAVILAAIEKYSMQARLVQCAGAIKTNAITNKSTELAEKVVSKELADALNKEFKALGAGNLHVSVATRSVKGKSLHKLKLELPQAKNPADILSEGEQRAIAIGSFLAEVNIGGGTGGVVFDDPVSSLDHRRRERVAMRLVQQGAKRQVIVFTHDVYFLCVLMEEADRIGVAITTQSLSKKPEGFGVADPVLPFEGMNTKVRIGALRNMHQQIAKLRKDGDEPEWRKQTIEGYRQLRIAWERAVEEVLFRKVVLRFRRSIETNRLAEVVVENPDYTLIEQSMAKCSNHAHDQALLGGVAIPEPDELLADIVSLDEWRIRVEGRSKEIAKNRKAAAVATP